MTAVYPSSSALAALAQDVQAHLGSLVQQCGVVGDHLQLVVHVNDVPRVLKHLRDEPNVCCKQLIDICGVDYPGRSPRFEVVYHLLSVKHNHRVRVMVAVDQDQAVPTATHLFSCADWWEREVWDMVGVPFADHPNLCRILTDYNFCGHPLRKDFPVTGYVELHYDEAQGHLVYAPVKLDQAFRTFDFDSPWEGVRQAVQRQEQAHKHTDHKETH